MFMYIITLELMVCIIVMLAIASYFTNRQSKFIRESIKKLDENIKIIENNR